MKIKTILKIVFVFIAFFIIYNKIDINQLQKIEFKNPIYLILGFLFFNLSQFISAFRIHLYLKEINITPLFKHQLILYYLGMFYNTILPGGIGGDGYKAYKFQKAFEIGYKKIIKALLIDRLSGLMAIFILLAVLMFFSSFKEFIIYSSLLLIITPFILYFIHKYFFVEFKNMAFKNLFFSILIQSLQAITFLAILLSLGNNTHLVDFMILFFISSIVSVIPLSVGGVGLRELTFLYGLEFLKLEPTIGVISAFVFFLITIISSSIGGIFLKKELQLK